MLTIALLRPLALLYCVLYAGDDPFSSQRIEYEKAKPSANKPARKSVAFQEEEDPNQSALPGISPGSSLPRPYQTLPLSPQLDDQEDGNFDGNARHRHEQEDPDSGPSADGSQSLSPDQLLLSPLQSGLSQLNLAMTHTPQSLQRRLTAMEEDADSVSEYLSCGSPYAASMASCCKTDRADAHNVSPYGRSALPITPGKSTQGKEHPLPTPEKPSCGGLDQAAPRPGPLAAHRHQASPSKTTEGSAERYQNPIREPSQTLSSHRKARCLPDVEKPAEKGSTLQQARSSQALRDRRAAAARKKDPSRTLSLSPSRRRVSPSRLRPSLKAQGSSLRRSSTSSVFQGSSSSPSRVLLDPKGAPGSEPRQPPPAQRCLKPATPGTPESPTPGTKRGTRPPAAAAKSRLGPHPAQNQLTASKAAIPAPEDRDGAFLPHTTHHTREAMNTPGKLQGRDGGDCRQDALSGAGLTPMLQSLEVPTRVELTPRSELSCEVHFQGFRVSDCCSVTFTINMAT